MAENTVQVSEQLIQKLLSRVNEVGEQQGTIQKRLEQINVTPASAALPGHAIAGTYGWQPSGGSYDWPAEKLKQLSEAYSDSAVELFCRRDLHNRPKVSGIGPAMVKMAAMKLGNTPGYDILKQYASRCKGGFAADYNDDTFQKQHGFVNVHKAYGSGGPDQVQKTALAENSGLAGGYLVPPQFMTELLTIAAEDGFIEQRAKTLPMTTRTAQWPMLDITTVQSTGTTPYFGGILAQWQPEASSINETEPQFKQTEWTAWDLVMYTVSSNQLLADNGIGLDALLTQLFGQAITWYKEYAFLQGLGSGASMPLGVLKAPATLAQNRAVTSRFVLADAAAMMSHLQVRSWDDACWVMHQSVLPQLIQMVDGGVSNTASSTYIPGNRLVWVNPTPTGDKGPMAQKLPNAFLNGLPIFFTEKVPSLGTKGDVMLIDWSKYVIGQRLDIQIDVSPHFLFRNNQLAWRVIARCDGKPWLNSYITDQTGWQVSPFIALN